MATRKIMSTRKTSSKTEIGRKGAQTHSQTRAKAVKKATLTRGQKSLKGGKQSHK